jgi:hypothetical protein
MRKAVKVFRKNPVLNIGIGHVYEFGSTQSKVIVIQFGANPAKVEDFGEKDFAPPYWLVRIIVGEVIPCRRDAR